MSLTAKDIESITRLLEASSFDELELEIDGMKLSLRRRGAVTSVSPAAQGAAVVPMVQATAPAPSAAAVPAASSPAAPTPAVTGPDVLTAPLLGTFYRSPRPGEPPFVEVGSKVEPETVVGIIEVMKLMNAVHAGRKGRVTEILSQDGALVEYGQALLRIEA